MPIDFDEIRKRQEELKKKVEEARRRERERLKKEYEERVNRFKRMERFYALVKVIDYTSFRTFVDVDGNTQFVKEGSVLEVPLPNAIPLVEACVGHILAVYPKGGLLPKVKLCERCKCRLEKVPYYECVITPANHSCKRKDICPFCGTFFS